MGEVQHIVTAASFTPEGMEPFFLRTAQLKELDKDPEACRELAGTYVGRRAVNIFYQESTRTRVSFEMAQVALGIGYSSTANARAFSSAAKGESLEHTIEVIGQYNPDLVVLRSDQTGGADAAAALIDIPIINAGDGSGEHPTQAFLDAFTIWEQYGRLNDLNLTFMGDLKFGRTVRSLVHIMSKGHNNHFNFVSDPSLALPDDIRELLSSAPGITYNEYPSAPALKEILPETDVFYVTRTQTNLGAPELSSNDFRVTSEIADLLPQDSILLHPMPIDRKDPHKSEIAPEVDGHPNASYYRQAGNGLYSRMAIIEALLEGKLIN